MAVGVDVGTAFLVAARKTTEGNAIKTIRNCYLKLDVEDIDMLKASTNTTVITIDDDNYIVGNEAMGFTALNANIKRPMRNGVLNPQEVDSAIILAEMIGMIAGKASPGEIACASIPSETSDGKINPIHHRAIVEKIFTDLGYIFTDINEGLAVIYANNPTAEDIDGNQIPLTGIGISMGGGMVNICYAYRGKKQLAFSIARSGDWIDIEASKNFPTNEDGSQSVTPAKISQFKEKHFSLLKDTYTDAELETKGFVNKALKRNFLRKHTIISSYYNELINYILNVFIDEIKKSKLEPEESLEIILSGGTSMPDGIAERFTQILKSRDDFPISIKGVRKSKDPLNSTALGALAKATIEEKKAQSA